MNTNEWVLNTHWVHMNAVESLLNVTHHGVTTRKIAFVSELNMPWTLVLVSAHECQWVSTEHPLNTQWVRMSANEWAGTAPEHPLNVHERLWVSIWKVWMHTSRVVNLTTLEGQFKLRVWTLASIKILRYRSKNMHTFLGPSPRYVWYFRTSTVYFKVQENCLKDLRIAKIWCITRFILSD
jgi:hypothetical protein